MARTKQEEETFQAAFERFGEPHQLLVAFEEMAELTKAISKAIRYSMEKDFDQMVAEAIVDTFYVPNPKFTTETVCRYNGAVDCESNGPKCRRCGFNPYNVTLHNERVERAMKRREAWLDGRW